MDIVLCSSNEFFMPMMVLIHSIMKNNSNINFHIIHSSIKPENIDLLIQFVNKAGNNIEVYKIEAAELIELSNTYLSNKPTLLLTHETFYRLIAIEVLNKLDKALYLDIDMIVDGSLEELWNTEFDGNYFIAVEDHGVLRDRDSMKCELCYEDLSRPYINAGMLLMNIKELKKIVNMRFILETFSKYMHRISQADQGLINMLWNKKIKLVNRKFNAACHEGEVWGKVGGGKPVVLHWHYYPKPWMKFTDNIPIRYYWHLETYLKYTKLPIFLEISKTVLENIKINKKSLYILENNRRDNSASFETYDDLNRVWDYLNENQIGITQYFYENSYKRVALYGLNSLTRRFIRETNKEIEISCIIDNSYPANMFYKTVPMANIFEYMDKYQSNDDIVIVMPITAKEAILGMLSSFRVNNAISFEKVIYSIGKSVWLRDRALID